MSREVHDAVLLAAGGSTRLGFAKQSLTRAGESLLQRAVRLVAATGPREFIVVLGAHREDLPGIRVVINERWRDGIASSLQAASTALDGRHRVLVAVCDQPALEAHHLEALLQAGPCAATRHGDRLGVPAVIDAAIWSRVGTLHGDRGFGPPLDPRTCVAIDAPELALDLDTAADVAEARRRGWID